METGNVVNWSKNEGDEVNEGDLLAEIETDKATMSFEASDSGFLAKILAPAGTKDIPVGSPLCIIVEDANSVASFKNYVSTEVLPSPAKVAAPEKPSTPPTPAPQTQSSTAAVQPSPMAHIQPSSLPTGQHVFISPFARKLASEQGIDLNQVQGSGTGIRGMFRASDLAGLSSLASSTSAGFASSSVAPKYLTESQLSIPHYYLTLDIEVDDAIKVRDQLNATLVKRAGKEQSAVCQVTLTDLLIKAITVACRKVPECNSSWQGDSIRQYNTVHVNVVVPTPTGVVSPVVLGAEAKGLLQIGEEVSRLVDKAKDNKLQAEDIQTGTFTLSNLGMFGISSFSAIIRPPQVCLLAVGQTHTVLRPDSSSPNGFTTKHIISCTLCCDHRVVDGAVGANWLSEFKSLMETPALMLA